MRNKPKSKKSPAVSDTPPVVPPTPPQPPEETAATPEAPPEDNPPSQAPFPIVGIGASAGGLAAFEAFFSGMPAAGEPGMAFVLVQHLAPDHKSLLADLIRRYTRMQVFEVEDGIPVKPNCAYIIPPGHDMALLNGNLQLLEPSAPRGQRLPIDFFFRSLAQDQHERAIGVVLSGTGSDGTLGVRAIKGEGGMIMVQNPESTEFDGMPRSAIATGLVDYELPPAEMPAQIIAYATHAFGKLPRLAAQTGATPESSLRKIFVLIRSHTGHDFSQYKPSTINRRVERRMAVHQIESIEEYTKYLQQTQPEVEALFRDLLIGVTRFFRDPEAFAMLEKQVVPKLFANKPAGGLIRVWSSGCSTGEEAYSIAILLQEYMEEAKQNHAVQIFATDIDSCAIATARAGIYPAAIAADVSPERLARFFAADAEGGAYQIQKSIRDMLIFSEHDLIHAPPFSRLDLVICRNLLIYFGADLQKKLIPLFHYALNPGGFLFLGTSEGVGNSGELFSMHDRASKLYLRKGDSHIRRPLLRMMQPVATLPSVEGHPAVAAKAPLREVTEQALLRLLVPAAALVNERGDLFYLHGRTGMFLEPAPGETVTNNIIEMAREGLRQGLTAALHKAATTRASTRISGLNVKTNSHFTLVNLTVQPLPNLPPESAEPPLFLVLFEEAPVPADHGQSAANDEIGPDADVDARIAALQMELRAKDNYLQSANEELETSNEELKSSNEEMQSINEELQSTNEELETSKEELQSVNEELATVNGELSAKVTDLSRVNNDMKNLLAGTGIATVFVDQQLHILRFTPAATHIINLIPSDIGRPVGHIVSNLHDYPSLVEDVRSVLDSLIPIEEQVRTTNGQWYVMRIRPYRTLENLIEGVVMTFVDITREKVAKDTASQALRLAMAVRDAHDAITVQDPAGRILAWSPGAVRMYGWSEAEALAMNMCDRIPEALREEVLTRTLELSRTEIPEPYLTQRIAKDGSVINISLTATALVNEHGQVYATATIERATSGK